MLKNASGRCHLKNEVLRTDRLLPHTEWIIPCPRLSPPALTQRRCVLLLPPPSCLRRRRHRRRSPPPLPPPSPRPSPCRHHHHAAITTMGRVMPCRQTTGCICQGKKSKMSIFCRCMGLSHLAVGVSLYRVLKYYSNVEYPPHRLHAKIDFFARSVSFFRPTARIFGTARKN